MKKRYNKWIICIILILSLTIISFISFAVPSIKNGNELDVNSEKIVEGTSLYTGNKLSIKEEIRGNMFVSGNDIEIDSKVDGNLFVAGNNIKINGNIEGTIFAAGNNINLGGKGRDAFLAGNIIVLNKEINIERDLFASCKFIDLSGIVGRDMVASYEEIDIQNDFKILGDLNYESPKEIKELEEKVSGKSDFKAIETPSALSVFKSTVLSILGILIVYLVGILIKRKIWINKAKLMKNNPLKSFIIGILTLIILPILAILFIITVIGIPIGFISLSLYVISIYVSQIIVGCAIGDYIFKGKEKYLGILSILSGIIIIKLLALIPFVGKVIGFMIICLGMGSIILSIYKKRIQSNEIVKL